MAGSRLASVAAFAMAGSRLEITNQHRIIAARLATLDASAASETRALQYSEAARRLLVAQAAKGHPLMAVGSEWEQDPSTSKCSWKAQRALATRLFLEKWLALVQQHPWLAQALLALTKNLGQLFLPIKHAATMFTELPGHG